MSILNVNKINPVGGGSTITIVGIASVTSSVTAPSFVGDVTGNSTTATVASGITTTASVNTSGIVTATSFVPTVGQLSHRNIIVNGAMNLAQRATSSTSSGIHSVDRFGVWYDNVDEAPTQEQYVMNSGDTGPWESGFRNALKVTNGNQTSGAGADDYLVIRTVLEAQNIANSGWNYVSSSSFITLSFWIKSSVAQNFYGALWTQDGTERNYVFETGSLTADTWTKITKTIPGNTSPTLQFDNDNGAGLRVQLAAFYGTNKTGSVSLNQWSTFSGSTIVPDMTSTWYTTNDSTLEITGVQLEVGPVATPFEHRSYADELRDCMRYFQKDISTRSFWASGNVGGRQFPVRFQTEMRATPTISFSNVTASGSFSAGAASRQGYNTYMSGSERFFEWRHTATAEL